MNGKELKAVPFFKFLARWPYSKIFIKPFQSSFSLSWPFPMILSPGQTQKGKQQKLNIQSCGHKLAAVLQSEALKLKVAIMNSLSQAAFSCQVFAEAELKKVFPNPPTCPTHTVYATSNASIPADENIPFPLFHGLRISHIF